jgi:hypothetical protein
MNAIDPRERLVETGNKLLDTIYKLKQWEEKWPELAAAVAAGVTPDNAGELMLRNMDGIMESLALSADHKRLHDEYYTLRSTIEALDKPRPSVHFENSPDERDVFGGQY